MSQYERAAEHIAKTCLAVERGDNVYIAGGLHQYKFLSKVAIHTRRLGGHPTLHITDDDMSVRMMTDVDEDILLEPVTEHERYMARHYDAALHVDSMQDQSRMNAVSPQLLGKIGARSKELREIKYAAGRRTIAMAWPTKARARRAGLTMAQLRKLFWHAVLIDLDEMNDLNAWLAGNFERGNQVHITSPRGTDITFRIDDRKILIDAGHYTKEMVARGEIMKNLPCGEVYTTAHEDSPEGVAVFDEVYMPRGEAVRELRCQFRHGKMIESSAADNYEAFRMQWDAATGDKDRIAEFAIGTNPAVRQIIGDPLFDEKIFGSVHLAIGENRMYGGKAEASIHWDFVILAPTVTIDDTTVVKDGIFQR